MSKTFDITPTPEFCEAADIVLGGHTPRHVLPVLMQGGALALRLRAVHAEIVTRKQSAAQ